VKVISLLPLMLWLLCGCAPDSSGPNQVQGAPRTHDSPAVSVAAAGQPALPDINQPSYEVSIASAEADRVRARDLCDSGDKEQRHACIQAADAAYDRAKTAAESTRNAAP
jgi:hypothetical protein